MSRLCAKPTCSAVAVQWFDVAAAEQRVISRSRATPSTIALCESHAARFSAPRGWTIEAEDSGDAAVEASEPGTNEPRAVAVDALTAGESPSRLEAALVRDRTPRRRARKHDRDRPWFLALSDTSGATSVEPAPDVQDEPSVGSLLHRAFHGPDRDVDAERAGAAERDTASAPRMDIELPFPPFDTEHHAAVS